MSRARDIATWGWYDDGAAAGALRALLRPASAAFGAVVRQRNRRYDADTSAAPRGVLPALSVGNLTVGGTGKTPVSSWFAAALRRRGASPSLVLRGYGDDEWRVHQLLTPDVPVHVSPDRVAAMREARAGGSDCAVLDDAFQHRRAPRVSDVVLVSADRWNGRTDLLPAGPFREPMGSLRRATAAVVTVKAASPAAVERVCVAIAAAAPQLPVCVVRLVPDGLHEVAVAPLRGAVEPATAQAHQLDALVGRRVAALSAIADPEAFARQLGDHGANLVHHLRFPDHHHFTEADVKGVFKVLHGADLVVCTLKDAVKLAPLWPRAATPLWYVSQTVVVDRGAEVLERECDRVLAAR